jgi:ADP-ribosyl-[dinitrogen reductase] hydrolase
MIRPKVCSASTTCAWPSTSRYGAAGDTDTVAAIAGGLLGAVYGASAVPAEWRRVLHGWPGMRTRGLVELASAIIRKGGPDSFDFKYRGYETGVAVQHPYDEGVWLRDIGALRSLPHSVETVVSLCRVGNADLPDRAEQLDVRLIDQPGVNDNLDFVLLDTVRLVEQLRRDGRTVLIHCVQAQSRTPAIAALYGARLHRIDIDQALADVCGVLPNADPIPEFRAALRRVHPVARRNEDD